MEQAKDRLLVLSRIAEYEKQGWFDRDVEDDPPTRPLRAGEVDYTGAHLFSRIATRFANRVAKRHFDGCIERGELVIREVRGIEHYLSLGDRGAMITANHFNAFDNYAIYKAIEPHLAGRSLYKIIREGNFTSFPGLYGFFFRHCNTIPLGSTLPVMKEVLSAVDALLKRGERILIYPEQGMWWNYRKPRPLKVGAFRFAARSMAPVLPVFITMDETDRIGADGFPILAYTLTFHAPIYPDGEKSVRENAEEMCRKNYACFKETYESVYGVPLAYTTEGEVSPCSI